jgi:hypothetical protein
VPQLLIGIVLLVVGIVLFFVGLRASESMADQVSNLFTGRFTDKTVWYMLGGGVLAAVGIVLVLLGVRNRRI